jgi:hypothetical protein
MKKEKQRPSQSELNSDLGDVLLLLNTPAYVPSR